jgi:hypothetical protein
MVVVVVVVATGAAPPPPRVAATPPATAAPAPPSSSHFRLLPPRGAWTIGIVFGVAAVNTTDTGSTAFGRTCTVL